MVEKMENNRNSNAKTENNKKVRNCHESSIPAPAMFVPVFVDPIEDFYQEVDVKQEPAESQNDFDELFEGSSAVDENSRAYKEVQSKLQNELEEISQEPPEVSIKEEDEVIDFSSDDDFEFVPPPRKRMRKSYPKEVPKEKEKKPRKPSELPSNMEEILQDPTRLPGGFKRGRYKVRSLTGVPYCKFCDKVFMNRKEKQAHVCQFLQCSDPKNYLCRVCNKELSKQSFSSHYHDAAGCQYCGKKFLNPRDIKEHVDNVHKGEEYRPPVITSAEVEEYVQKKLQEEGHIYEKRAQILARNLEHTGPKIHTCQICQESFRNPRSLARHAKIHTDAEKFACEYCGKICFSKSNLLKHLQWVHKHPKSRENKKRKKVETKKIPEKSPEPETFIEYEIIDEDFIAEEKSEEELENFEAPKPPITKIKSYIKAPSTLLPGNIKPGRYKIRNCTGVPFCKFCDTIFVNRKEKQAHDCEFLKCDPKNFICRVCRKELSKQSFSSHSHDAAGCQYCGKKILNPKDMKSHIAAKHRNEEYKPPLKIEEKVVEEYFQQKLEHEAHIYELRELKKPSKTRRRRNFKVFTCDRCGEEEETKKLLEIHILTHIRMIFKCTQCDEAFETKSAYKNHRMQHSIEIISFHCDFCGKNFNSKENIRTHQKNVHGYGLRCESCKIPVDTKEELMAHMKEVHGSLSCQFCGKIFLIPSKLKAHEIRHMVQAETKPSSKSYICQFCRESFYNSTALNYHLRFHNACDVLTCEFCGKNFPTAMNLKTHQARKHQIGISCEICKLSMESKESLKEHMASHGTFECEICSKSFVGPSKLKAHQRTHSKAEEDLPPRVECDHCPRSFLPSRIRNHMFKFHREKFDEWLACNN